MSVSSSDAELVTSWRAGNADAGKALFERHFDSIFGFFETKCASDADDLAQSTFLAILRAKEQFRQESSFRTYLFTIARNELYRLLRTRQRRDAKLDFELSSIMDLVSTPGTKLARNQEHRRLVEAMQHLPVEQQILLELHYWEDMEIPALAEIFDSPAATIRTRLHRARKALAALVETAAPKEALETLETMDAWAKELGKVPLPPKP